MVRYARKMMDLKGYMHVFKAGLLTASNMLIYTVTIQEQRSRHFLHSQY